MTANDIRIYQVVTLRGRFGGGERQRSHPNANFVYIPNVCLASPTGGSLGVGGIVFFCSFPAVTRRNYRPRKRSPVRKHNGGEYKMRREKWDNGNRLLAILAPSDILLLTGAQWERRDPGVAKHISSTLLPPPLSFWSQAVKMGLPDWLQVITATLSTRSK